MPENELPPLTEWEDFFNYEAERISKLSVAEIEERIKEYSKVMFGVRAMQSACVAKREAELKEVIDEEKKKVYLEDLKYVPPSKTAKKKETRQSREEKSIKDLMKTLGISKYEAEAMVKTARKADWGKINESGFGALEGFKKKEDKG